MEQQYKYYAFISYSSKDTEWGKRVLRKLENYRMPATLCNERGWKRTPIKPIFFAPNDIQLGGLSAELQERLRASRNLIVIGSPNSAQSEWVGEEIRFFHRLGRANQIYYFIIDGLPHSGDKDTECFHPVLGELGMPEILGANIHDKVYRWPWLNRERAYVQLVSTLLGVEFDTIWQRHKRQLVRRIAAWTLGLVAVLAIIAGVWLTNQPVDVELRLNETSVHNDQLPPMENAVVTMQLDNEVKTDTIAQLDGVALFTNIPHRFLNKEVRLTFACPDFMAVDTMLTLTQSVVLNVQRNPQVYGSVRFRLYNPDQERVVPHVAVEVGGFRATSDADGQVRLDIPLEAQRPVYRVEADIPLRDTTLTMPCGEDDVVRSF